MTTETTTPPNARIGAFEGLPEREITWLERILGPEIYRILRGVFTNPMSVVGVSIIALFFLVALLAPVLAPPANAREPYMMPRDGFKSEPQPPGTVWKNKQPPLPVWWGITGLDQWVHIMGTSGGQWDIYYGIIWGCRTALRVGITIEGITLIIGILIGSISAFYGGWVDYVIQRITEVFMAFPSLLAALTLSAVLTPRLGKGLWAPLLALIVFGWMGYSRIIRGDILSVRERDYVMAARVLGVRDNRIILRHIIPNAIYPTMILASMNIGSDVISFAALSFLGIGTEVGYSDWGQLISFARNWIPTLARYWYIVVYPAIALVLFTLGWNLCGDALRDIMDPRMRGRGA